MIRPAIISAVFWREVRAYFTTPAGYMFISLFIVASASLLFIWQGYFFSANLANLNVLNAFMPWLLLLFIPAVTMSSWSDERRQGTDALLLTLPATDADIVLGKYLGVVAIYSVALIFSLSNVIFVMALGEPDIGLMAGTYFGYWLMGLPMLAAGLLGSMVSRNATIGFILGAIFCGLTLAPDLLGWLAHSTKLLYWSIEGGEMTDGAINWAPTLLTVGLILLAFASRTALRSWALPIVVSSVAASALLLAFLPQSWWNVAPEFGVIRRFTRLGQGELVLGDVLYFPMLSAALLFVAMLVLGRRFWAGSRDRQFVWMHAVTRGAAVIVAAIALVTTLGYSNIRADVTAERLHTLSPVTTKMLAELASKDEIPPVEIQAYVSPEMPSDYLRQRLDLLSLLQKYSDLSRGKVRVTVKETRPFTANARTAREMFGIEAVQVATDARGSRSLDTLFLGLVISSGTERDVVPFLHRGLSPEYELTRSIRLVTGGERKKVGVLDTGMPLFRDFDPTTREEKKEARLLTELRKQYEVVRVGPGTDYDTQGTGGEPLELSALVVPQPNLLTQEQMNRLLAYIKKGEPVLLLQDPFPFTMGLGFSPIAIAQQEAQRKNQPPQPGQEHPEPKGDLSRFLSELGVAINTDMLVWDRSNPHLRLKARTDESPEQLIFARRGRDREGEWSGFDDEHPVSSGLQEVLLLWAGSLGRSTPPVGAELEFVPLISTSRDSGTATIMDVYQKMQSPMFRNREMYKPTESGPLVLAGRIEGKFAEGNPARVSIVADTDLILNPEVWSLREAGIGDLNFDNVTFILNAIDELSGDNDLLELRKRRPLHRTLATIEQHRTNFERALEDATRKAEDAAKAEIERVQGVHQAQIAAIDEAPGMDKKSRDQLKASTSQSLQTLLNRRVQEINTEKDRTVELERERMEERVSSIEDSYKVWAVVIPPIPALLLGIIVLFLRRIREYSSIGERRTL